MIKETEISPTLMLIETDEHIELSIKTDYRDYSCELNQLEAIHLRNSISIWANNKRNRDLKREKNENKS